MEEPKEQHECTVSLAENGLHDACEKAVERRRRIIEEAVAALAEASAALDAIVKENTEQALVQLEKAAGKLELMKPRMTGPAPSERWPLPNVARRVAGLALKPPRAAPKASS